MAAKKKRKRSRPLSHTRPPVISQRTSLSSRATRSVIRKHHTLQKQLHTAVSNNDTAKVESTQAQLAASGGLQKYQAASIQGQSSERGGDTSKVLMEWIHELVLPAIHQNLIGNSKPRLLEVGALKVDNICSRSGIFDVTRIDLHSQHPEIQTQDFMKMPLPSERVLDKNRFDIVSLSLVVNYVGDVAGRGEMLKRVASFLRSPDLPDQTNGISGSIFPGLFLVLPAPCVTNSRYLDEERLEAIMTALGYVKLRSRKSKKLVYYLWQYEGGRVEQDEAMLFKKQEVRSGSQRNNFTIVLQ